MKLLAHSQYDLLMGEMKLKVVLKYSMMENGAQFVMIFGTFQMLMSFAGKSVVLMVLLKQIV